MNKDNFLKYAELKTEEKRVKGEIEALGPVLKGEISAAGADKVDVKGAGLFTLKKVQVFEFSDEVKAKKEEVKKLEEHEKATGVAKASIREDLVFTAPKVVKEE